MSRGQFSLSYRYIYDGGTWLISRHLYNRSIKIIIFSPLLRISFCSLVAPPLAFAIVRCFSNALLQFHPSSDLLARYQMAPLLWIPCPASVANPLLQTGGNSPLAREHASVALHKLELVKITCLSWGDSLNTLSIPTAYCVY